VSECVVCGDPVAVSRACTHCARPVCAAHRDPAAHDCPGAASDGRDGWFTQPEAAPPATGPTDEGGDRFSAPRNLALALAVLAFAAAVAGAGALADAPSSGIDADRVERVVAAETNERRAAAGLDRLAPDRALARVAAGHSRDMARRNYFAHRSPDDTGLADRYRRAGIDCPGGENIYLAPNGGLLVAERALGERIVREWMASPGHRENVLTARFDRQGIGVVVADGRVYATQNFC
jgi:uncharacterized protein YkwD